MSHITLKPTVVRNVSITIISMIFISTLFYFYEYFLRVTPSVMKSQLQTSFGLTETAFGFMVAFYYYAYTPMQIPVGILMDRYGPKRVLTLACALCTLGTFLFASTNNSFIAQLAQFLIGFGSAFAYVGVLKISDDWLAPKYFALMAGLCTTLGMIGAMCGEVISEFFVEIIGWKTTLLYAACFGVLLTPVLWCVLRNNKVTSRSHKLQYEAKPTGAFLAGITEVIKSPQIWITGFIGCLTYLPICVFAGIWAPDFLVAKGFDKTSAAFGSSLLFLGFAIGCPFWGYLSDLIKSRRLPLILGSFLTAFLLLVAIWLPDTEYFLTCAMLFLTGFFSGVEILIFAVGNDLVRSSICATAASFINMMTMIGAVLLPPIIGKLLDQALASSEASTLSIESYCLVLTVLPLGLALAGIFSTFLKESYPGVQKVDLIEIPNVNLTNE